MINNINNIVGNTGKSLLKQSDKVADGTVSFSDVLENVLAEVNEIQKADIVSKQKLSIGEIDNFHDPMIAAEKADIALQFTAKVHGKIIDAYKEIMRLQV